MAEAETGTFEVTETQQGKLLIAIGYEIFSIVTELQNDTLVF